MAIASIRCLVLTVLVVFGILVLDKQGVSGQCEGSIPTLIAQCSKYVQISGPKVPPSQECCNEVKVLDLPCICKFVTPEIEKIISAEKAIFVARTCGVTVEPGFKCGSYTVPPS